jgi:hypothetical protein
VSKIGRYHQRYVFFCFDAAYNRQAQGRADIMDSERKNIAEEILKMKPTLTVSMEST